MEQDNLMYADDQMPEEENVQEEKLLEPQRSICGFWRRLIALLLDTIVLGLVGLVIGLFASDFLFSLGVWGRVLGFGIALCYFGFFNSVLFRGQTIGKKVTGIRVVDAKGNCISIFKSLIRYIVLGVPFFLNRAPLPPSFMQSGVLVLLVGLIVFGVAGAIIYLYLFNRRTRQSLHDLLVGSFVVRSHHGGSKVVAPQFWQGHLVVAAIILVLSLVVVIGGTMVAGKSSFVADLITLQKKLYMSGVNNASVFVGKSWGSWGETTYLSADIWTAETPENFESIATEIASVILSEYPQAKEKDRLIVGLVYGYDIGIWSYYHRAGYVWSPQEWEEKIIEFSKGSEEQSAE